MGAERETRRGANVLYIGGDRLHSAQGEAVGEHSNFKKNPTHTQDHGDGIATRGESVVHVPS